MGFQFEDYEDQRQFELFAFGKTHVKYDMTHMHIWNSLHGDKVWLRPSDNIDECLQKMYDHFMENIDNIKKENPK
jgi:hypothetical protein